MNHWTCFWQNSHQTWTFRVKIIGKKNQIQQVSKIDTKNIFFLIFDTMKESTIFIGLGVVYDFRK